MGPKVTGWWRNPPVGEIGWLAYGQALPRVETVGGVCSWGETGCLGNQKGGGSDGMLGVGWQQG